MRPNLKVGIASCVSFQIPQLLIVTAQTKVFAPVAELRVRVPEIEVVPVTVITTPGISRVPVVIVRLPPIVVAVVIEAVVLVVF